MKPTSDLFELIKSLSKSEKRSIKLLSGIYDKDKTYLKLFELLDKQKTYDEEAIKKIASGEGYGKHYASLKKYLYRTILNHLQYQESSASPSYQIKSMVQKATILYNRNLLKQSEKWIDRAYNLAKDAERFEAEYEILTEWKIKFYFNSNYHQISKSDLDELFNESELLAKKIRYKIMLEKAYRKLSQQIVKMEQARGHHQVKNIKDIFDQIDIPEKDKDVLSSFRIKTLYLQTLFSYYYANNDSKKLFQCNKALAEHCNLEIASKLGLRGVYIATISNYLVSCVKHNRFQSFQDTLKLFKSIEADNVKEQFSQNLLTYQNELFFFLKIGNFDLALELSEKIEGHKPFYSKLTTPDFIMFNYMFAYANFGARKYTETISYLNRLFEHKLFPINKRLITFAKVLNVITHYELTNDLLISSLTVSTKGYLKKNAEFGEVEHILIEFCKKITNAPPKSENRKKIIQDTYQRLQQTLKDSSERLTLDFFDSLSWIQSKADNRSFAEVIRDNVNFKVDN